MKRTMRKGMLFAGALLFSAGLAPFVFSGIACTRKEEVQLYQCPMHPEVKQDHPGKCPICGMDLVPVAKEPGKGHPEGHAGHQEKEEHPAHGVQQGRIAVTLGEEELLRAGIRTRRVERRPFTVTLSLPGRIRFDPKRVRVVTARVGGWVTALYRTQPGESVQEGEVLYRLYSPEAFAVVEEYRRVKGGKEGDPFAPTSPARESQERAGYPRYGELLERSLTLKARNLFISPEFLAGIQEKEELPADIPFVSPFSGTLAELFVRLGDRVEAGSPLLSLAELSTVIAEGELPLGWELPPGGVEGEVIAPGGTRVKGEVAFQSPEYNPATRSRRLQLRLKNPAASFIPGSYVELRLKLPYGDLYAIPDSSLIFTGEGYLVFVEEEPGRFVPRTVDVVVRDQGWAGVKGGVRDGDQVVEQGTFLLDADSRLRAYALGSGKGESHAHTGH